MPTIDFQNTAGVNVIRVPTAEKPFGIGNAMIQPPNREQESNSASVNRRSGVQVRRVPKLDGSNKVQPTDEELMRAASMSPRKASGITVIKLPRNNSVRAVRVDTNSNQPDKQRGSDEGFPDTINGTNKILVNSRKPTTANVLDSLLKGLSRATSAGEISVIKVPRSALRVRPISDRSKVAPSTSATCSSNVEVRRLALVLKLDEKNESLSNELQRTDDEPITVASISPHKDSEFTVIKLPRNKNVSTVSVDANLNKLDEQRHSDEVFSSATNKTNRILVKSSKPTTANVFDSPLKGRPRATSVSEINVVKIPKSAIQVQSISDLAKVAPATTDRETPAITDVVVIKLLKNQI